MKYISRTWKPTITSLLMLLFVNVAFAQYGDDYGDDNYDYGDEYNEADTGDDYDNYDDYNTDDSQYNYDFGNDETETVSEKPKPKPYVRFTMPIDTITELVTYSEIVEIPTPKFKGDIYDYDPEDLVSADSFHYRAVKWMIEHYGPDTNRYIKTNYWDNDHEQWRLEIKNSFNLYIRGTNTKSPAGKVYFNLTLRLRDNRYKIQLDHLVHEMPQTVHQKKPQKNYFEYYLKSETGIRENDRYLMAAEKIIEKMIEDLKKAIAPPAELTVDREDF